MVIPLDCKRVVLLFSINGLMVGAYTNTMENTMLRKSFKMREKIAD
jgi:hypothetical protein